MRGLPPVYSTCKFRVKTVTHFLIDIFIQMIGKLCGNKNVETAVETTSPNSDVAYGEKIATFTNVSFGRNFIGKLKNDTRN